MKIWTCKIGEVEEVDVPDGGDSPMRQAVEAAYLKLTGKISKFAFTGWDGELNEIEREVIDHSQPKVNGPTDDLLETAWVIIANSYGGNWDMAGKDWREAAERWRDKYHETLPPVSDVPDPVENDR